MRTRTLYKYFPFRRVLRWSSRNRAILLRALLTWLLTMVFATFDRDYELDLRFQIRAPRYVLNDLVIVKITKDEAQSFREMYKLASNQKTQFWYEIIQLIQSQEPKLIGIVNSSNSSLDLQKLKKLNGHFPEGSVLWSLNEQYFNLENADINQQAKLHHFSTTSLSPDHDGIYRRYGHQADGFDFVENFLSRLNLNLKEEKFRLNHDYRYINFAGPAESITTLSLSDLLSKQPSLKLKDKSILIENAEDSTSYLTPVGNLSQTEIIANVINNSIRKEWVQRPDIFVIGLVLMFFVAFTAWIMTVYPQALALPLLLWVSTLGTAVSIYTFDAAFVLFPILPIWIATFTTYMSFLSLQVSIKDYQYYQLEKEREFLLNVEELKNNFLSLISHDLKTPIAKLQGICDRILSKSPPEELASDVQTLRNEASELHRYIKTILQVTKVESRDFRLHPEASDINEIIESVCEQLSPLAQTNKVQVNLELEPMFLIEVDPILIHEVILNVIENAIKYSPEGSQVKVRSHEVDQKVVLMVEDNGPGIPEAEQTKIFDRFYRGAEGKKKSKGSGLGLYLVKYFVELHGGQISLQSKEGAGACFGIHLPILEKNTQDDIQRNNKDEYRLENTYR